MEKSKLCFEKTGPIEQLVPIEAFSMSDLRKQRCKNFLKEHQYQMNKTLSFYGIGGIAPVLNEIHTIQMSFTARYIISYLHLILTGALHHEFLFLSFHHTQRITLFFNYNLWLIRCQLLISNCGKTILPNGCCY